MSVVVEVRRNKIVWSIAILLATTIVASCSSSSSTDAPTVDADSIVCESNPAAGLGDGEVCVDSGVRSESLFTFANWGGRRYKADDFGYAEMIALYGEEVVCGDSKIDDCTPTPKARMTRNVIDGMLQNGRCEGMTALGALYMTSKGPDPKLFDATSIQDLNPRNEGFANVVDYWWGTQLLTNVVKQSDKSRKSSLKEVLGEIIGGISENRGITIGLYSDDGAHSVLPVAVTKDGENSYYVHVWDSNSPNQLTRIKFDMAAETWTYAGGRVNTSTAPKKWSGPAGTIDVVSLVNRDGKPVLSVEDAQRGDATVTVATSSDRALAVGVKTKAGGELLATTTGTIGSINGVKVTPIRNGDTSQLIISIANDVSDFSLEVSSSSQEVTSGSTQLTINNGDDRAFSLAVPNTKGEAVAIVSSGLTGQQTQEFTVTSPQKVLASATTQQSLLSIPTNAGESVSFSLPEDQQEKAVVSLTTSRGSTSVVEVSSPRNGTTQDVVLVRDNDGGLFSVSTPLKPIVVDENSTRILSSALDEQDSVATKVSSEEPTEDSRETTSTNFSRSITNTSFDVLSRITSENDGLAWLEFSPDENWSDVKETRKQRFASGVDVEVRHSLANLLPGTPYRYRLVMDIGGALAYSLYSSESTTGEAPESFAGSPPDGSVRATATLVASTATGGVVLSRISTPVAASAWIEYAALNSPSVILTTSPTAVRRGQETSTVLTLNGLSIGQTYRYRVVVKARDSFGYSTVNELTTGSTVATVRVSTVAIGATFSHQVNGITSTSAIVSALLSSPTPGRVLVEYSLAEPNAPVLRSRLFNFSAGRNIQVSIPLSALSPSKRYNVRLMVTTTRLSQYGTFKPFGTLPADEGDTSGGRLTGVVVPTSQLKDTTAVFQVGVKSAEAGTLVFEYGVDNPNGFIYTTDPVATSTGESVIGPIESTPVLRAGTPSRVRAVLTIGNSKFRSAFTKFTTTGQFNTSVYTPSIPTLRRSAEGVDVQWTTPQPDAPSSISFVVLEGATQLCSVAADVNQCSATFTTSGLKSIVVAALLNGVEIGRSGVATINIGLTPVISSFSFVSATQTGITFTFSFNPRGENVQYGIEIRTPQDVLVKPDLIGQTGLTQNGGVHQVTGLTPGTPYKARLVLVYGSLVVGSSWINVATQ